MISNVASGFDRQPHEFEWTNRHTKPARGVEIGAALKNCFNFELAWPIERDNQARLQPIANAPEVSERIFKDERVSILGIAIIAVKEDSIVHAAGSIGTASFGFARAA